jgi:hypothetical protein
MDFICLCEIEHETFCNSFKSGQGQGGEMVEFVTIWNCHNESPLYNTYIIMKRKRKKVEKKEKVPKI